MLTYYAFKLKREKSFKSVSLKFTIDNQYSNIERDHIKKE